MADKKENKYDFWKRMKSKETAKEIFTVTQNRYYSKYYNLWMSKFKWSGLDEDNKEQQENYIMRKLWTDGTLAARAIDNTDYLAFAPYSVSEYNYLDFPESVVLVNKRGVSTRIIPDTVQIVNKDVVLLYALPGHDSIERIVRFYTERIAQAAVLVNNNLALQNMPFIIGCDENDRDQLDDIVNRILNNELVVFSSVSEVNRIQALVTQVPYIVDKLQSYIISQENELLTILGIDNSGAAAKKAQMLVDEVNANNDVINDYGRSIEDELRAGLNRLNIVFNRNVTIEPKSKPVDTTKDYEDISIKKNKEEQK